MIAVWINGERREEIAAETVAELVRELKLSAPTVLVEHNGVALHREEWSLRPLRDGDRIELLRVVAGG